MTRRTVAWRSSGPPVIEIARVDVVDRGRRWVQVVVTAQGGLPGVVVIAESDGCIALVKQFRPAVESPMWELPRGFGENVDVGCFEDAASQARRSALRELAEETGMRLTRARYLGGFFPDSGLLSNRVSVVHGFVGRNNRREARAEVDEVAILGLNLIGMTVGHDFSGLLRLLHLFTPGVSRLTSPSTLVRCGKTSTSRFCVPELSGSEPCGPP
jgi:8-oxo-dGTP pyrophosphatase MutT (NUDIX family)